MSHGLFVPIIVSNPARAKTKKACPLRERNCFDFAERSVCAHFVESEIQDLAQTNELSSAGAAELAVLL
jgi:hypothetical protein